MRRYTQARLHTAGIEVGDIDSTGASKATAGNLADAKCSRIASLNQERTDVPADAVGPAVVGNQSSVATINRVKQRTAAFDQREVMDIIDREVDAARADRP